MNEALNELEDYLLDLGNHTLESRGRGYAIVRNNKNYSFDMDFVKLEDMGFRLNRMSTNTNGKLEIVIYYVG